VAAPTRCAFLVTHPSLSWFEAVVFSDAAEAAARACAWANIEHGIFALTDGYHSTRAPAFDVLAELVPDLPVMIDAEMAREVLGLNARRIGH